MSEIQTTLAKIKDSELNKLGLLYFKELSAFVPKAFDDFGNVNNRTVNHFDNGDLLITFKEVIVDHPLLKTTLVVVPKIMVINRNVIKRFDCCYVSGCNPFKIVE